MLSASEKSTREPRQNQLVPHHPSAPRHPLSLVPARAKSDTKKSTGSPRRRRKHKIPFATRASPQTTPRSTPPQSTRRKHSIDETTSRANVTARRDNR